MKIDTSLDVKTQLRMWIATGETPENSAEVLATAVRHIERLRHPVWAAVRHVTSMAALTVILLVTASKFDYTEIRTIIIMFVLGGMSEGALLGFLSRFK